MPWRLLRLVVAAWMGSVLGACASARETTARAEPRPQPSPAHAQEDRCIDPTDEKYGAVPDDDLDDSGAFNRAIRDGNLCIPAGTYTLSTPLIALSDRRISGSPALTTQLRDAGNYPHIIEANDVDNLEIDSLAFDLNGSLGCATAIATRNVRNIDIHHNRFNDRAPQHDRCDNWAISFGSQGFASERITIHDNDVAGEMQLTANGGFLRDVRVEGNKVQQGRTSGLALTACKQENITIAKNIIHDAGVGIYVGKDQGKPNPDCWLRDVEIVDNTVTSSKRQTAGIMVQAHDLDNRRIRIVGNRVSHASPDQTKGISLELDGLEQTESLFYDTIVAQNVIDGAGFAIFATRATDLTLLGNSIQGGGLGISLEQSSQLNVLDNIVRGAGTGLVARGTEELFISRNQLLDSGAPTSFSYGLVFLAHSTDRVSRTAAVVCQNRVGDTRPSGARKQDYAVVQAGDGEFATHFFRNDFSSNAVGPIQQGTFETWKDNAGPLEEPPEEVSPSSRVRVQLDLRFGSGRRLAFLIVAAPAAEPGDLVVVQRDNPHKALRRYTAWVPRAGLVALLVERSDASAERTLTETISVGILRRDIAAGGDGLEHRRPLD